MVVGGVVRVVVVVVVVVVEVELVVLRRVEAVPLADVVHRVRLVVFTHVRLFAKHAELLNSFLSVGVTADALVVATLVLAIVPNVHHAKVRIAPLAQSVRLRPKLRPAEVVRRAFQHGRLEEFTQLV